MSAAKLIAELSNESPEAACLAEVVSLAARVEPSLLRRARLELVFGADVSAEADLWWSPLVQARSADSFIFLPEVAAVLRDRLAKDHERLDCAYAAVSESHRSAPSMQRLEEELTWLALSHTRRGEQLTSLLRKTIAALADPGRARDVAAWAVHALPRLPEAARVLEPSWLLAIGASAVLGGQRVLSGSPPAAVLDDFPALHLGEVAVSAIRIQRRGSIFRCDARLDATDGNELIVPHTNPIVIEVGQMGSMRVRLAVCEPGGWVEVEIGGGDWWVRTLAGNRYQVRAIKPLGQEIHWQRSNITRSELRQLISRLLRTDSDQDAFVLDYFHDVYRLFTAGMDRTQKVNLLFEQADTDEILQALEQQYPAEVRKFRAQRGASQPASGSPEAAPPQRPQPDPGAPHMVCLYADDASGDRAAFLELRKYLTPKLRAGSLTLWSPDDALPGEQLELVRALNLEHADVVVLLVSPDFLADAKQDELVKQVLKRRTEGRCVVVPVLIAAADWKSSRFGSLQPVPRDGVPIRSRKDRDAAWVEVVEGLSQALQYRPLRDERVFTPRPTLHKPGQTPESAAPALPIGVIFTVNETPKYTYVEPEEYAQIRGYLANGSRLVIQGPSCCGKSSTVRKALEELSLSARWLYCSEPEQVAALSALLAQPVRERLIIDEAHCLEPAKLQLLAGRLYNQQPEGPICVIGLGDVRGALIDQIDERLRGPLARRLMGIVLTNQRSVASQQRLEKLVALGESVANIQFTQARELIDAAGGSYYMMQLLCYFAATSDGVPTAQRVLKRVNKGMAEILPRIMIDLNRDYATPLSKLAKTDEVTPPRGAVALLLWLLGRSTDGEVGIEAARLQYPTLGKAFDWLLGGPLAAALKTPKLTWLLEFKAGANVLRAHDPRLLFYLRNLNWSAFLSNTGHTDLRLDIDGRLHHYGSGADSVLMAAQEVPRSRNSRDGDSTSPSTARSSSVDDLLAPQALKQALKRRAVVPFAGAGVSRTVLNRETGRPLFPDWKELLLGAAERLREAGKEGYARTVAGLVDIGESDSLLDAAKRAQQGLGAVWFQYLREALDPPFSKASPESLALAQALWTFGNRLVITTNYDRVLSWACPDSMRQDQHTWDISAPAEFAQMLRSGLDWPTVWHLHGYVGNLANIILTPDGYQRLYPDNALIKNAYEASLLTLRAVLSSRTLLLVGFSFTDQAFREQVRFLDEVFHGAVGPHYMLVEQSKLELTRERLRGLQSIDLIPFANRETLPAQIHRLTSNLT